MKKELLEDFIDWARDFSQDAWYIFDNTESKAKKDIFF